jgi:hypothetical protein
MEWLLAISFDARDGNLLIEIYCNSKHVTGRENVGNQKGKCI